MPNHCNSLRYLDERRSRNPHNKKWIANALRQSSVREPFSRFTYFDARGLPNCMFGGPLVKATHTGNVLFVPPDLEKGEPTSQLNSRFFLSSFDRNPVM